MFQGTSLAVQLLRFYASTTRGLGLILGWGTKIPHAALCSQKGKEQIFTLQDLNSLDVFCIPHNFSFLTFKVLCARIALIFGT